VRYPGAVVASEPSDNCLQRGQMHTFELHSFHHFSRLLCPRKSIPMVPLIDNIRSSPKKNLPNINRLTQFLFYISHSRLTPNIMKSLLVAAFTICVCAFAHAQQSQPQEEASLVQTAQEVLPPEPPDPLYLLSDGEVNMEITKEDLAKLNITEIESLEIVMDEASLKEYGEKGKNGVMIISLRKEK
jgi:hypothetical protein